MLVPTDSEIDAESTSLVSGRLPAGSQKRWLVLFRQLPDYGPARLPAAATALASVSGYDAQVMLAILKKIDGLGQKLNTVEVANLTRRKKDDERLGWVRAGVALLFETPGPEATSAGFAVVNVRRSCCGRCFVSPCCCPSGTAPWT